MLRLSHKYTLDLQYKIDTKTKPMGALGLLERLALQLGRILGSLNPVLNHPSLIVFAGDHGLAEVSGISAYPSVVTEQMVYNFCSGGAAINAFARQHHFDLKIVDAGVKAHLDPSLKIIHSKVCFGTQNSLHTSALTLAELEKAMEKGRGIVRDQLKLGCNVIGFGEMGIGNSSASALLYALLYKEDVELWTGKGTGLEDISLKVSILKQVQAKHQHLSAIPEIIASVAGAEMAMMIGAMLEAARSKMVVLVDGFIATACCTAAEFLEPGLKEFCVFCHLSDEQAHARALAHLEVEPILKMGLRLGEGTGAALAYPLLVSATAFLREMASFESAGVSTQKS